MSEPIPAANAAAASQSNGTAAPSLPRIGERAPDFRAVTTHGELTFSEWAGDHWVVLFSHPADFTPVCSTELLEFARRAPEFVERGTRLIGLSVDSVHAHLAWVQNLKERAGVSIEYPLISDVTGKIARRYGMFHPHETDTATVRAVFFIDPKRTVRATIYYPLNVGRSVDEILRVLDGLQTTDAHSVAVPVNWKPGEQVIVPPPKTQEQVAEREQGSYDERVDFYLVKKSLS